jgi:hypothetical protein
MILSRGSLSCSMGSLSCSMGSLSYSRDSLYCHMDSMTRSTIVVDHVLCKRELVTTLAHSCTLWTRRYSISTLVSPQIACGLEPLMTLDALD